VLCAFLLVLVLPPALLSADPERSVRIERLTHEIEAAPVDARLHLRRGTLLRMERAFERALADFEHAAALQPDLSGLDFAIAQLWLDAGRPERAYATLDRLLAREPADAHARVLRARSSVALGDRPAAIADLTTALGRFAWPMPELYLERAALQRSLGTSQLPAALAGLDEGIARLGSAYTLVEAAIGIELELEHWAGAFARSDALPELLLRQPEWQARRADWLRASGREDEARAAYRSALAALRTEPGRRTVEDREALQRRLVASLEAESAP
jgi:hypothetical protein